MSWEGRSAAECPVMSWLGCLLPLIIWQGGKAVSLEYREGAVNFGEQARHFGVCVMQTGEQDGPHQVV